jgi:8-oxo-dGTP pyrophosphatase MutT (NUDIX family)
MNYTVERSSIGYKGKILSVHVDEIMYAATGRSSKREVVVKDAFAMVLPVRADGKVVTVTQYRHPFQEMAISFPAGRADEGEEPCATALRELEEEAGLRAGQITKLAVMHEVPEFARSVGHLYVATDLSEVPTRREEGEATMSLTAYSEAELRALVASGKIKSVTVQAALYHYLEHSGRVGSAPSVRAVVRTGICLALAALAGAALAARAARR